MKSFLATYRVVFKLLLIILILFQITVSFGQPTQNIRGMVVDKSLNTPLPGATVILIDSEPMIGTATDANGAFRLENIPVGRHTLKISYISYEEKILPNLLLTSGKELILIVEMEEEAFEVKEIVIKAKDEDYGAINKLSSASARLLSVEEANRFAGTRSDPSRMAANYAGVASASDQRNDIVVRGNSPFGVLWRLEGVQIPNPNHFAIPGTAGGALSMLNNNLLQDSDFFTSAFPAEYGNKLSAVFDIRLRKGNDEKYEFMAQAGINGLEIGAEGPFDAKTKGSFLINYRFFTLEAVKFMKIDFGLNATPSYHDISFKFHFPTTKAGNFSLFGLAGKSNIKINSADQDSTDWSIEDKGNNLQFGSEMGIVGANHTYFFNSNMVGKLSVAISAGRVLSLTEKADLEAPENLVDKLDMVDGQAEVRYEITKKYSSRHLMKTGITYQQLFYNYHHKSKTDVGYKSYFDANGNAGLFSGYFHINYKIAENLAMNSGVNYQYFGLNNERNLDPRLGLSWEVKPAHTLNFGYGLHSQTQPLYFYNYNYPDVLGVPHYFNKNLEMTRSHHLALSYDYVLFKNYRLKLETYYQYLYHVPIEDDPNSTYSALNYGSSTNYALPGNLVNNGSGQNYGLELTLEKFFAKDFYFLATATLYESKYVAADKVKRFTAFSGTYLFNVLGGYEFYFGKKFSQSLGIDLKANLSGGKRYTPIDLASSIIEGRQVNIESLAFAEKFKPYFRTDAKISYRINTNKTGHVLFVAFDNVFDTKNVLNQHYDDASQKILTEYQIGIFPYAGYRIEF